MNRNSYLCPETYPGIHSNMVAIEPSIDTRAKLVEVDETPQFTLTGEYDGSLSRQLGGLHFAPQSVHPSLASPPEVILMTAFSAIPVADAIRGFYEELDAITPLLGHIQASSATAHAYYSTHGDPNYVAYTLNGNHQHESFAAEVKRLKPLVEGSSHVTIVDQFVGSGKTITYGAQLLLNAGAKKVSAIRGDWYVQAGRSDIDMSSISSRHAPFMASIGRKAAQVAFGYAKHFANKQDPVIVGEQ